MKQITETRLREILEYFTKALEDDSFQPDPEPTDDEMKAALSYALACCRAVEAVRERVKRSIAKAPRWSSSDLRGVGHLEEALDVLSLLPPETPDE